MRQIQRADGSTSSSTSTSLAASSLLSYDESAKGIGRLSAFGGGRYRLLFSSTNWVAPSDVTSIRVRCYGSGGGGGSGARYGAGGGGGGGGFAMSVLDIVPGRTYHITVGAPSAFEDLVVATAGSAGLAGSGVESETGHGLGGAGGAGTAGDICFTGGAGGNALSGVSSYGFGAGAGGGGAATQLGDGGGGGSTIKVVNSPTSGDAWRTAGGGGILFKGGESISDVATPSALILSGGGSAFGRGNHTTATGLYSAGIGGADASGVNASIGGAGVVNPLGALVKHPFDIFSGGGGGDKGVGGPGAGGGSAAGGGLCGGGGGGYHLSGDNPLSGGDGGLCGGGGGGGYYDYSNLTYTSAGGVGGAGCVILEW